MLAHHTFSKRSLNLRCSAVNYFHSRFDDALCFGARGKSPPVHLYNGRSARLVHVFVTRTNRSVPTLDQSRSLLFAQELISLRATSSHLLHLFHRPLCVLEFQARRVHAFEGLNLHRGILHIEELSPRYARASERLQLYDCILSRIYRVHCLYAANVRCNYRRRRVPLANDFGKLGSVWTIPSPPALDADASDFLLP